jgi:3-methylcrotonyl-CoA carboxylase alpha subunit
MIARPFRSLLIANRGEIACRIARTARRMGLRTVAVYSEADARARHVKAADEARLIGPAPARDSYLNIERLIAAAKASRAEAIHPGYGFLSEKAEFADACADADLVFVGPPAAAIRAMGSKSAAKALMEKAGVPIAPGYHGKAQDLAAFARAAEKLGFPVLLKAVAGGGGKGMRIVRGESELADALSGARREAEAAFGDGALLMEKFIERPRHIEVQVFGDTHGTIVSLFERECTLQRRHQKVIEEAPSAALDDERREALYEAARKAAGAIGYVGAGTVEFVADGGDAYFIEMNTRLQVEHPVTEAITGLDLVEWQLRVAMGERLPLEQHEIERRGHAIEARVYAEDAAAGFLPSVGEIAHWRAPDEGAGLRIDAGFGAGDAVSRYYDPMLAKAIAHADTREAALARLRAALSGFEIAGVTTNIPFLTRLLGEPAVLENAVDTGFIEREMAGLGKADAPSDFAIAAAVAAILHREREETRRDAADPYSPWAAGSPWTMAAPRKRAFEFRDKAGSYKATLTHARAGMTLEIGGEALNAGRAPSPCPSPGELALASSRLNVTASASGCGGGEGTPLQPVRPAPSLLAGEGWGEGAISFAFEAVPIETARFAVSLGGARRAITALYADGAVTVFDGPAPIRLALADPFAAENIDPDIEIGPVAPMPGTIIALVAAPGEAIEPGAPMLIMEAMKMEHTLRAPSRGRVARYLCAPGEFVAEGAALLEFEAEGADA